MIPRILHQVWVGERPMPECFANWTQTFRKHHPDWTILVWAEHPQNVVVPAADEIRALPESVNASAIAHVHRWTGRRAIHAARSDCYRYEIVARYGGVYADTDVEWFQPIDPVLRDVNLFVADEFGASNGNYLFGARPNHPALWTAVRDLTPSLARHTRPALAGFDRALEWASAALGNRRSAARWRLRNRARPIPTNPVILTGPRFLNDHLQRHPDCVVFPWPLFNPLDPNHEGAMVQRWPASAIANHHYAGTWYDRIKTAPPREFR